MSDLEERKLVRLVAIGDVEAKGRLRLIWVRTGRCFDCGQTAEPPPPRPNVIARLVRWTLGVKPDPPHTPRCYAHLVAVRISSAASWFEAALKHHTDSL